MDVRKRSRRDFLVATVTSAAAGGLALGSTARAAGARDLPGPRTHVTYYLSAQGRDTNSGTDPQHPWRTVAPLNAIQSFGEGVQILFRGGDSFAGGLQIRLVGTERYPCLIGTYGTGDATLTDLEDPSVDIIQLINAEQFTLRNLRLMATPGTKYGTFQFTPVSQSSGLQLVVMRSTGTPLRNVTIEHCTFRYSSIGIYLNAYTVGLDGFENLTVRNCLFDHLTRLGVGLLGSNSNSGGPVDQSRNVVVEDCRFLAIYGDPNFASEAQPIYVGGATGIGIRRNLVGHCCGYGGYNPIGGSTAIGVTNCRNFVIQYNEIFDTRCSSPWDGSAIDVDQDSQNGEISHNLTYNNFGPGIQFGSYGGKTTSDIAIHHNISYNDARGNSTRSVQGAIRGWGSARRIQIFNNTVYLDGKGTRGAPSILSVEAVEQHDNREFLVANNIFKTAAGVPLVRPNGTGGMQEPNPTHLLPSIRFLANLYDSGGEPLTISTDDYTGSYTPVITLAAWRAAGQERQGSAHLGVVADAGLAAPTAFTPPAQGYLPARPVSVVDNFDLTAGSAARGHGMNPWPSVTLRAPLTPTRLDFHGMPATGNDIGAARYRGLKR